MRNGPPEADQDDSFDGMALIVLQHLEDRIVLAVDGEQLAAALLDRVDEEAASRDETFLVGKRDIGTAPRRCKRRGQTRIADDCRHHPAGVALGRFDQAAATGADRDPAAGKRRFELLIKIVVRGHRQFGAEPARLFGKKRDIAVSGQRDDLETISPAQPVDDVERVCADRTGGAQYRQTALRAVAGCHCQIPYSFRSSVGSTAERPRQQGRTYRSSVAPPD